MKHIYPPHHSKEFILSHVSVENQIGGVMVSVLVSIAVDCGIKPDRVKSRTTKLVSVASPLSMQHKEKEQRLVGL